MKHKIETDVFRKPNQLEILKAFTYTGLFKGELLNIFVYDKITKKVYAGNIELSSYKREEIKKLVKDMKL